ncbi:hypothetical protein TSUD_71670 [Trifolium subterraneum]|uniref:Uncharacterized protein n=1 Tax=Trifolium subterraneum TaxID=3900 RepID=A0A2Z6NLT8_TRISU|nr:hypothetical protein TSUD_71670 [Trifolium subterraneum]
MASAQCYKTCEQSCQQQNHHQHQQQHSSIGQKLTGLFGHHNEGTQTKTQCYSQTEVKYQPGHVAKNQTSQCNQTRANHVHAANGTTTNATNQCNQTHTNHVHAANGTTTNATNQCNRTHANHVHTANGTTTTAANCQGKNRRVREHKRNMFQRIKDGVSGHSSDSGSSSDESDSDNENRRNRKATLQLRRNCTANNKLEFATQKSNITCVVIVGKYE